MRWRRVCRRLRCQALKLERFVPWALNAPNLPVASRTYHFRAYAHTPSRTPLKQTLDYIKSMLYSFSLRAVSSEPLSSRLPALPRPRTLSTTDPNWLDRPQSGRALMRMRRGPALPLSSPPYSLRQRPIQGHHPTVGFHLGAKTRVSYCHCGSQRWHHSQPSPGPIAPTTNERLLVSHAVVPPSINAARAPGGRRWGSHPARQSCQR